MHIQNVFFFCSLACSRNEFISIQTFVGHPPEIKDLPEYTVLLTVLFLQLHIKNREFWHIQIHMRCLRSGTRNRLFLNQLVDASNAQQSCFSSAFKAQVKTQVESKIELVYQIIKDHLLSTNLMIKLNKFRIENEIHLKLSMYCILL